MIAHPESSPKALAERYRVLLDIGRTLTGTLSPDELFRAIYREAARVVEASGFYIALYEKKTDLATVVFYADRGAERRVEITFQGSASGVIRDGKGTVIDDRVQTHSLMVLGDEDSEITRSAISVPLRYKNRVVGAISCQSYAARAYDDDDMELLQGIADLAAVAIENARYISEIEARRREAERIEEIGLALTSSLDPSEVIRKIVDAMLELLSADSAHLWLFDGEETRVAASRGGMAVAEGTRFRFPPELLNDISMLARPIQIPDVRESALLPDAVKRELRVASGMLVPLVIGAKTEGFLSAGHRDPRPFTDDQVHIAQRLASQVSAALANARLHERVQALSLTDPLTGLPNRRHLQLHLQRELAAARRGRPLSVVIFDLDYFKIFNDTRGHVAGDEALREMGRVLSREGRAMNVAARYGGDEFVSVLAGASLVEAERHARRICESVSEDGFLAETGITLSYGVGEYAREMSSIDDLIRAADRDLYRKKATRPPRAAEPAPDAPESNGQDRSA